MKTQNNVNSVFHLGALGMWVLAGFNAVLLVGAWIAFAIEQPEYFSHSWPTFSRALSSGDPIWHGWLAGIAGLGLLAGGLSLAAMRWRQAATMRRDAGLMRLLAVAGLVAGGLGIVHFLHVVISLRVDNDLHMAMSYTFFFGMTFLILFDLLCRPRLDATLEQPELAQSSAHRLTGFSLLGVAILFLLTFVLKDWSGNPWPDFTEKLFVVSELVWIVLAHAYAVFYVPPMRRFFHPDRLRRFATLAYPGLVVALAFASSLMFMPAPALAAKSDASIGGTGHIQPVGGVMHLSGPHGHQVEQVLAQIGQRVRKGDVLLVLADRTTRTLERDLAEEKLRSLEQHSVSQTRVAELDVEAAQQMLAQARERLAQIEGLDARTFSPNDKRQREYEVKSAETSLRQAKARLAEMKQGIEADRKVLRRNLELAGLQLAATQVRAPRNATVLEVNVHPGTTLGGGAAIILADTTTMYVQGDFFEGDLPKLAAGQRVKISNNALGTPLYGVMERIGRVVDPVNRLVKAWIKLDKPSPADRYIGMQVDLRIEDPVVQPTRRK